MFTVIWNPLRFHVIDKCPIGTRMNSDHFITNILASLEQKLFPDGRKFSTRRLTIHLVNYSIHTSRPTEIHITERYMMQLIHSPYSLNLALSEFYLFPTIKARLKDTQMVDEGGLFYLVKELLNEISRRELAKVFGTWINCLMAVSRGDGAYIS
jgi:hypothetical protein